MKKTVIRILFISAFLLKSNYLLSQTTTVTKRSNITVTKIHPKIDKNNNLHYDSIKNYLGRNVDKYIGQELYLLGKQKLLRTFGYSGFHTNEDMDKFFENTYKPFKAEKKANISDYQKVYDSLNNKGKSMFSDYDLLVGKHFKVLDVIKKKVSWDTTGEIYKNQYFLKLKELESSDIVYYDYDTESDAEFDFLVVGYLEKLKKKFIGKTYVFSKSYYSLNQSPNDINTGEEIKYCSYDKWKCTDVIISDEDYRLYLVLKNSKNNALLGNQDSGFLETNLWVGIYTEKQANNYLMKFGSSNWNLILQGIVQVGMTKEMCKLAWASPILITNTGLKTELWTYTDESLIFEKGLLKKIIQKDN